MPMTLQGLQEVGLADWPSWYRRLNPGYFVNDVQAIGNRTRTRVCAAGAGQGGACCGSLHGGNLERKVGGHSRGLRERGAGKGSKTQDLGEQVIARLRSMARKGSSAREKRNVMIEKAAAKVTRTWEDESDNSNDGNDGNVEVQQVEETKAKLVDF